MKKDSLIQFLLLSASAATAVVLFYLLFRYLLRWLLPFLLALGISAVLEPFICWGRTHLHLKRGFSAAVATIACVVLLGAGLFRLSSAVLGQATSLLQRLPSLFSELPALLEHWKLRWMNLCALCPEPMRQWGLTLSGHFTSEVPALLTGWSGELLGKLPSLVSFLPEAVLTFATTILAVFYTSSRYEDVRNFLRRQIPLRYRGDASDVKQNICLTMARWFRAEALLWLLTFSVLLGGLLLLRVDYALLLAFLISFVDLLPVLGTGTILLPWAALALLIDRGPFAIGLLSIQLILLLQRSLLEPKLLAAQADLPPIAALLAMYLGFCSMGITGMILFPVLLLLAKQLQDEGYLKLWK